MLSIVVCIFFITSHPRQKLTWPLYVSDHRDVIVTFFLCVCKVKLYQVVINIVLTTVLVAGIGFDADQLWSSSDFE